MPKIHPTAIVDPNAELAGDVELGPHCVIEGSVKIGPGCRLREHVTVRRYTTLGGNNLVDAGAVFGGEPQDLKFDPDCVSYLRIGDDNVFRECVTISRATGEGSETVVGSRTYWMVGSHAGHNAVVEDEVVLTNNAAVAGFARIGRRAILSANVLIHQFCWVGELVMSEGAAATRSHVPPYTLMISKNQVAGLNTIGLRRAEDITDEDRRQINEAFKLLYRSKLTPAKALEEMDACTDWGPGACRFREFVRSALEAEPPFNRGLCPMRVRIGSSAR